MKAFADDKMIVNGKFKFGLGRLENNVGKRENVGYQLLPSNKILVQAKTKAIADDKINVIRQLYNEVEVLHF